LTVAESLVPRLKECGYGDAQIKQQFKVDQDTIPVVAFAGRPFDSWSACIAVVDLAGDSKASAEKARTLGTPAVFVCGPQGVDWWAMGAGGPTASKAIAWSDVRDVFHRYREDLAPSRIYNAKLRRPDVSAHQLWFFDVGLMPAVEMNRGQTLLRLVDRAIGALRRALGAKLSIRQAQEDAYRTVFWLLAAKVLHDKSVDNFIRLDLKNVAQVFDRIGKHHGETDRFPPFGREGRQAIEEVAETFANCGSLADVSSESIAYVYENALIDNTSGGGKAGKGEKPYDIRKELGIHSTPSVLIHHMLSQMWTMIEKIPPLDRNVFEPACGHAPFLTGAMRWLRDWNPNDQATASHDYLRSHLHGLEADAFAIELAKLALTLADEPHGNSWQLTKGDMFLPGMLAKQTKKAHILLSNPPYEAFTQAQRARYRKAGEPVTSNTKATEMLLRTLPYLPVGGVFGVVVPQGFLYQDEALEVRRFLAMEYELSEIALFADNLFEKGDAETAILLGCRKERKHREHILCYRRVREHAMESFKDRLAFSSEQSISQARFEDSNKFDMRVPELEEVWNYLGDYPTLQQLASVGQGLIYHGKDLPAGAWTVEPYRKGRGVAGFAEIPSDLSIFGLPTEVSINLASAVIRRPVAGTTTGIPQVLLNYHPVSRDEWRLKAVIDQDGHAVTSSFLAIRPRNSSVPLEYIWALLNSPVANAYAFCFLQKRNILSGRVRLLAVPKIRSADVATVTAAAIAYRELARLQQAIAHNTRTTGPRPGRTAIRAKDATHEPKLFDDAQGTSNGVPEESKVLNALMQLDAAVLKLYRLPPRLERRLLDQFANVERKGVGCSFRGYYPLGFTSYLPLHEILSDRFQRAKANITSDRFKPGESAYVRDLLNAAAERREEE